MPFPVWKSYETFQCRCGISKWYLKLWLWVRSLSKKRRKGKRAYHSHEKLLDLEVQFGRYELDQEAWNEEPERPGGRSGECHKVKAKGRVCFKRKAVNCGGSYEQIK